MELFLVFSLAFGWAATQEVDLSCTTPNGNVARCISLYSCPKLMQSLATLEPKNVQYVKKSQCGYLKGDFMVCCSDPNENKTPSSTKKPEKDLERLFNFDSCGYQAADSRERRKNKTAIDEFPWIAMLNEGGNQKCSGSLISNQYVLTSASCTTFDERQITSVTLGLYNRKQDVFCNNKKLCTDAAQRVDIETIITHENYDPKTLQYDVALLRLKNKVPYTGFIRAICLPFGEDSSPELETGDTTSVSGWGSGLEEGPMFAIKKNTQHLLVENDKCGKASLEDSLLLCTVPESETDGICKGDRGGPLMRRYEFDQWFLEGIVLGRLGACEKDNPEMSLNIRGVVQWILDTVEE